MPVPNRTAGASNAILAGAGTAAHDHSATSLIDAAAQQSTPAVESFLRPYWPLPPAVEGFRNSVAAGLDTEKAHERYIQELPSRYRELIPEASRLDLLGSGDGRPSIGALLSNDNVKMLLLVDTNEAALESARRHVAALPDAFRNRVAERLHIWQQDLTEETFFTGLPRALPGLRDYFILAYVPTEGTEAVLTLARRLIEHDEELLFFIDCSVDRDPAGIEETIRLWNEEAMSLGLQSTLLTVQPYLAGDPGTGILGIRISKLRSTGMAE